MTKKVLFPSKPQTAPAAPTADQWVAQAGADTSTDSSEAADNGAATAEPEPLKRLTLDIPVTLHTRIKSQCALRQVKMVEEIRLLLENHFAEK